MTGPGYRHRQGAVRVPLPDRRKRLTEQWNGNRADCIPDGSTARGIYMMNECGAINERSGGVKEG